ncbi:hypothetical protein B0H34DRAFT_675645 [Crassisporium funariophilum]|nr:hypothetical protein B0H34DRAFT_675645 [Crassisporium funariophilum]
MEQPFHLNSLNWLTENSDAGQPSSPLPLGPILLGNQQMAHNENMNPVFQFGDQGNMQKFFTPSPTPMRVDVLRHGGGMNSAVDFCMQVIRLATDENLKQSGNPAYNKLVMQNFELETEIRVCNIWSVEDWQKTKKKNDDASIQKKKGRPAKTGDSMTRKTMAYIQDAQGKPVTEACARDMCNKARKVFSKLEELKMALQTWTKISSASSQYYRQVMYGYFPELQFCDGDWKAERLGIDIYPSWSRQRAEEDDAAIKREEGQDLQVEGAEENPKKRKPTEDNDEVQEQRGKRARNVTESATTPNTSDNPAEVGSIGVGIKLAEEQGGHLLPASTHHGSTDSAANVAAGTCTTAAASMHTESTAVTPVPCAPVVFKALNLKHPLSATLRVLSPLSVGNSGAAPAPNTTSGAALGSNTTSLPPLPANANSVSTDAASANGSHNGLNGVVGNEIEAKTVDNSVNRVIVLDLADSAAATKEAASPQVAVGAAHPTATEDSIAANGNTTQASTVDTPTLSALCSPKILEATKKKPAVGDMFRFQPNNCVEWNLFEEEYSKSHPHPTKQEVRAAYDALSDDGKQTWSQRRTDKLATRKTSGKKQE